jgi:hypothetical protein
MTQATEYAILLPGDESAWERATEAERAATYARHQEFMRLLAERGHRITGGAELTPSRTAHVVRGELDAVSVTDGPFAETVEQLTGFYLVATDDLDDLLKVCGLLAGSGGLEVRALVPSPSPVPAGAGNGNAAVAS